MSLQFRLTRILWVVLAVLTLAAAGVGVFAPQIYDGLVSSAIEPGIFTQDLVALVAALLLIFLAAVTGEHHLRRRSVSHGIMGFLFYAYGIYAMERVFSVLYPLYLAILAMSFFVLVRDIATAQAERVGRLEVRRAVRIPSAVFAIVIAVMFNIIWFSQLIPLIAARDRIDFLYSIYVIDLCFIMPAFVLLAISALRNRRLGLIGLPAMFVLGAGILSPLAIAELLKPSRYSMALNPGEFRLYLVLTLLFLLFAAVYLAVATVRVPGGTPDAETP